MQIIPAIDIIGGKCVRLKEGRFSDRTEYSVALHEIAQRFKQSGARYLHVVDLDGAKEGHVVNWDTISQILSCKGLQVQVGGGVRTDDDVERLLQLGAVRVVVGSVAIQSPEIIQTWCGKFGASNFCVALDVKDGILAHSGWQKNGSVEFGSIVLKMKEFGINRILTTDIRKDGMLTGPNVELYKNAVQTFPGIEWIASGGVHTRDDIRALETTGVAGVVIGKALYEGTLRLEDVIGAQC